MPARFYHWALAHKEKMTLLTLLGFTTLFTGGVWFWVGSDNLWIVSKVLFVVVWMAFPAVVLHTLIQGRLLWPLLKWVAWGALFRIPKFILFGGWGSYLAWAFICVWLFATTPDTNTRISVFFGGMFAAYRFYRAAEKAVR